LLQKTPNARVRVGRLQQLDLAACGSAERQKGDLDTLAWEVNDSGWPDAKGVTVECERRVEALDDDRDVIDALDALAEHGYRCLSLAVAPGRVGSNGSDLMG